MQEIVENGKYKNLNDIKAALSKESFEIDVKMKVFDWLTVIRSIKKKNFLSLKQWKDFKPIMNRFHMVRFQERQQVTKSENAKHFAEEKLRKGISGQYVTSSPVVPMIDKFGNPW